ncbi:hypothetical protein PoB_006301300 [Plakobranchus ocellatus]|uniref:Uncharacterized protein n=1 Tax=Plakobranchus ocellatus TaxID=259542 RepID=A0AAV4CX99_9GAST|nr:hypothetical protein PoB_006301300 [Plakobranchus ocellatus]
MRLGPCADHDTVVPGRDQPVVPVRESVRLAAAYHVVHQPADADPAFQGVSAAGATLCLHLHSAHAVSVATRVLHLHLPVHQDHVAHVNRGSIHVPLALLVHALCVHPQSTEGHYALILKHTAASTPVSQRNVNLLIHSTGAANLASDGEKRDEVSRLAFVVVAQHARSVSAILASVTLMVEWENAHLMPIHPKKEPHFCPWEAEVTVSGTVRGHCTATAGDQRMTLGYLDDGTKLDFCREKFKDDKNSFCQETKTPVKGKTNNARLPDATVSIESCGREVESKQRKKPCREEMSFSTAYVGENGRSIRNQWPRAEERQAVDSCNDGFSRYGCYRNHQRHHRCPSVTESDSDQSSYQTASEAVHEGALVSFSGRYPNSSHEVENIAYSRRKSRRKNTAEFDLHNSKLKRDVSNNKRQAWQVQNYHNDALGQCSYAGAIRRSESFNFNVVSDDDCSYDSSNDDIDYANPHHFPTWPATEDGCARFSDRRYLSPERHSRRRNKSRRREATRHHSGTSKRDTNMSHTAFTDDLRADSRQSSETELDDGKASQNPLLRTYDRHRWKNSQHLKHSSKRKNLAHGET